MSALVLRGGRIYTGDPSLPWASAAVVRDRRFLFVGRDDAFDVPPGAKELDLQGRLVLPGLTDGHAHLLGTGMAMHSVNLKRTVSAADAAARVAAHVSATPAAQWIRGAGWDQHDWPGNRFPDRRDLDNVAPEHPVVLTHTSGHCTWVNTLALRTAGITAATPAPAGGAIDLDDGEPSGILRDNAMRLVSDVVLPPSQNDRIAAVQDAVNHAHSLGLTGVHAMDVGRGELQALHALNDAGKLHLRVRPFLSAARIDEWVERNLMTGDGDDVLRIGGVKFFADGALGSLTAWMLEPYEASGGLGLALQSVPELEEGVRRCLEQRLAPAIHAIGDRANGEVLDILTRLQGVAPELPRRIEHAQLLAAADIARFAYHGITASVQPIHATQDMAKVDREWGARGRTAYAFASLLSVGASLAFGSDSPVETMDPLAGIHAAVTRRNAAGQPPDGWYPEQRISLEAAIDAYTAGCARAGREDGTAGRIAPGYHADFVVLSEDVFKVDDPMRILDAHVDVTAVAGEIVYRRDA